jgi:hypothetical protein
MLKKVRNDNLKLFVVPCLRLKPDIIYNQLIKFINNYRMGTAFENNHSMLLKSTTFKFIGG